MYYNSSIVYVHKSCNLLLWSFSVCQIFLYFLIWIMNTKDDESENLCHVIHFWRLCNTSTLCTIFIVRRWNVSNQFRYRSMINNWQTCLRSLLCNSSTFCIKCDHMIFLAKLQRACRQCVKNKYLWYLHWSHFFRLTSPEYLQFSMNEYE